MSKMHQVCFSENCLIMSQLVSTIKTIIIVTFYRHHHSIRFIMVRNCRSLLPPLKVQPGHSLLFLEPGCHLLLHLERRRKSPLIRFWAEMLLFCIISGKVFKWRFRFKWFLFAVVMNWAKAFLMWCSFIPTEHTNCQIWAEFLIMRNKMYWSLILSSHSLVAMRQRPGRARIHAPIFAGYGGLKRRFLVLTTLLPGIWIHCSALFSYN